MVAPNTTATRSARDFELGQIVFCLEWQEDTPRIVTGEIVALDEKVLVLAEVDGSLFNAQRRAPRHTAYIEPREALHAELEWLRWFSPYSGRDPQAAIKRARRAAGLMDLWKSLLPVTKMPAKAMVAA